MKADEPTPIIEVRAPRAHAACTACFGIAGIRELRIGHALGADYATAQCMTLCTPCLGQLWRALDEVLPR